ncbi:F0F1 ATP synthase subunit delta [bacterium]|nr:F0F1 ATP synthase subunit delta [bacterium]
MSKSTIRTLQTKGGLVEHLEIVRQIQKDIYKGKGSSADMPLRGVPAVHSMLIREELVGKSLDTLVDELQRLEKETEVVVVKLAFEPTKKFTNALYNKLDKVLDEEFLVDIEVEPEIGGGCVIIYKGKNIDLSLDKMVDKYFSQNKDAFSKLAHR